MYSVQVGIHKHIDIRGTLLEYTSHSCNPNCNIKTSLTSFELYAKYPLMPGDAPTFDYEISEWCMSSPFECMCGEVGCRKLIRGFKFRCKH